MTGFFLAAMHAFFSLSLLSPAYYDKYFDDVGQLNLQGEIALSVGVVALFFLLSPAVTTLPMMPKLVPHLRHNTRYASQIDAHDVIVYPSGIQWLTTLCDRGGIGIRAGFRILWGNPWEFESPRSHCRPCPLPPARRAVRR